ncbi:MAG: GyrI-like domain-containing protein, partial [Spirochaeta sp.]
MESREAGILEPVHIEENYLHAMRVAYVRHTGPYAGNPGLFLSLHRKLITWAGSAGALHYPERKNVVVYHDPMGITEDDRLRISVGITVPADA